MRAEKHCIWWSDDGLSNVFRKLTVGCVTAVILKQFATAACDGPCSETFYSNPLTLLNISRFEPSVFLMASVTKRNDLINGELRGGGFVCVFPVQHAMRNATSCV
jgi:hypothetical protein